MANGEFTTVKEIPLRNKKGEVVAHAIVDAEDYEAINAHRWYMNSGYAMRSVKVDGKWRLTQMHRAIMNAPQHLQVDHINRDRLDNRKGNLRLCAPMGNAANTPSRIGSSSKYKGVNLFKRSKKPHGWVAEIQHNRKRLYIGVFDTEEEAARARDKKAVELHGEFAYLNFPQEVKL